MGITCSKSDYSEPLHLVFQYFFLSLQFSCLVSFCLCTFALLTIPIAFPFATCIHYLYLFVSFFSASVSQGFSVFFGSEFCFLGTCSMWNVRFIPFKALL